MNLFRRLNLPAAALLLLLQRSPALRVAAAAEWVPTTRIVALLKSMFATAASLGVAHSLAGATQFEVSASNVLGTVGTPITPIKFTVTGATTPTGAPMPAGSFEIIGLPNG